MLCGRSARKLRVSSQLSVSLVSVISVYPCLGRDSVPNISYLTGTLEVNGVVPYKE